MRKSFLFGLLAAVCAAAAFGQPARSEARLAGLQKEATVTRDGRSIPYIEAASEADLYFMQGYTVASDRLWQMDLLRRVARGETAEIFGRTTIEEDKRWRRYGFAAIAEATLPNLPADARAALENYARGVNAYIATLTEETTPMEFRILRYKPREWTPADTIVIGKILADALSNTWQGDLQRLALQGIDKQKYADLYGKTTAFDVILFGKDARDGEGEKGRKGEEEKERKGEKETRGRGDAGNSSSSVSDDFSNDPVISLAKLSVPSVADDEEIRRRSLERVGLYAEGLAASNNWVISGKRTADGKPILANDPHLMPAAPGIWYLVHLAAPGMRVAGVTFPGVPGVVLGHNEHFAWGATNVGPDVQDLYLVTIQDGKIATPDGWAEPTVRKEVIKFRANPLNPELSSEELLVTETRNGPVIVERGGKSYALRWTALDPKNDDLTAFLEINRAKDWNGFKQALSKYAGAMQNFIYADTKGNIGWYAASKIPVRRKGDGSLPYDGATTEGDWVGTVPFAELPNLYNPPEGFIMTANQRIAGTDYKHQQIIRDFAPPWRARRLYDLLSKDTKATLESSEAAQFDAYNIPLAMLAKDITDLGAVGEADTKALKEWDGRMMPDSYPALLVNELRNCAANKMAASNQPVSAGAIRERVLFWAVRERTARWLPSGVSSYGDLFKACDAEAKARFAKDYGAESSNWTWGRVVTARFPHPLAAAPLIGAQFATPNVPIRGSGQTPNVASAVSMRHIVSPGNWDTKRFVIPLGQSGDPRSPHFKDQFEAWSGAKAPVFVFSKDAVAKAAASVTAFRP
ncbi:MAG: penicillin acylase family protein [Acidobacteria bacterium]|nr:penicillin acylase family protein [Acidobacteriota bacterium]